MIPIFEFLILFFQLTSIVIYIFICVYLLSQINKSSNFFQPSFIIHFTFNAIFDFLSSMSILLFRKVTYWGYFHSFYEQNTWISELYKILFFQTITLTISGNIIISVNRFYALYSPVNYSKIWNAKLALIIVLCQIAICYLSYTHLFFTETAYIYDPATNSHQFTTPNANFSLANNGVLLTFCIIGLLITVTLNLKIFQKFRFIFQKGDRKKHGAKITMIIFMILAAIFLLITTVQISIRFYAIKTKNSILKNKINDYFFYSIPILSALQPYLLIFLSNQLRNGIIKLIFNVKQKADRVTSFKVSFAQSKR
uniref:G_PROTEIN_RECEP_F1_2 domain-containing protein n=1 Tax=Strongyloides stercoralis TaxID=6248 RepID=A0A0K0E414_STRER